MRVSQAFGKGYAATDKAVLRLFVTVFVWPTSPQVRAGEHLRQNIAGEITQARRFFRKTQRSLAYVAGARWHVRCFIFVTTSVQSEVWLQRLLEVVAAVS